MGGSLHFCRALFCCALALLAPAAQGADELEPDLASKVLLKVMLLDQDLMTKSGGKLVIGVIGAPRALESFSRLKGTAIDPARAFELAEIVPVQTLPPLQALTALFVGADADLDRVTRYTRARAVLSVTNLPELVEKGVTLGVGLENNRPKVLLNLTGSEREKLRWDPKILKISRVYR
jgi:hypothetical protein